MARVEVKDIIKIKGMSLKQLRKKAVKAEELAKKYCPKDTGNLARTIHIEEIEKGFELKAGSFMGITAPYASAIEYGTPEFVKAHGVHDPENPVMSWKAKQERIEQAKGEKMIVEAQSFQRMPFLRPAVMEALDG